MQLLAVTSFFHRIHHDVLRRHERQLAHQMLLNHLRIYHQAVHHVQAQIKNAVDGKEALGNAQALVGGIVQGSLKPLGSGGNRRVEGVRNHVAGQRGDPLAAHGISLIGHGGGTDLALFKRLLHLLQVLQQADVIGHLGGACRDAGEHIQHSGVYLSGVGLAGYRIAGGKAHLLRDHGIQSVHLIHVAVKQLQEGCLSSGGSLGTQKLHGGNHIVQILQIQVKLLHPQGGALSYRGGLSGLKMGECQRGKILVAVRKGGKFCQHVHQFFLHQLQSLCHDDDVRIVAHIAGGRAQMDDALCLRALHAVSINMAHHVMAHFFFPCLCHIIVDVVRMAFQLFDLLIRDGQAQLLLRLRQRDPQPSPGAELLIGRKNVLHFLTRIPLRKRAHISVRIAHSPFSFLTLYTFTYLRPVYRSNSPRISSCGGSMGYFPVKQPLQMPSPPAISSSRSVRR